MLRLKPASKWYPTGLIKHPPPSIGDLDLKPRLIQGPRFSVPTWRKPRGRDRAGGLILNQYGVPGAWSQPEVCCRWACCVGGITRENQPTCESRHPFEQSTKLVFIPGAYSGEDRREAMKRNLRQVWLRTHVMRFGPLITSPLGLMDKASDF